MNCSNPEDRMVAPSSLPTKEKLKAYGKKFLKIATEIIPKLPSKDDSTIMVAIKMFGIWDSVVKFTEPRESSIDTLIRVHDLLILRNFFFQETLLKTDLISIFKKNTVDLDITASIDYYQSERVGNFYAFPLESRVGEIYVSKNFSMPNVLGRLWDYYPSGISFDSRTNENWNQETSYSHIPESTDPTSAAAMKIMAEFMKHHKEMTASTKSRSYLFLGVPGTGKSTFAYKFAKTLSNRIFRVTESGFANMKYDFFEFIVMNVKPDIIIVDDIDRSIFQDKLLQIMEDIPKKYPWLTVIFTANKLENMDPAFVRPGRIDEVIEFDLPNKKDRVELLELYLKSIDAQNISEEYINTVANLTDKMSQAWIKEVALQMKGETEEKLIARIKRMLVLMGRLGKKEEKDAPVAAKPKAKHSIKKSKSLKNKNGKSKNSFAKYAITNGSSHLNEAVVKEDAKA